MSSFLTHFRTKSIMLTKSNKADIIFFLKQSKIARKLPKYAQKVPKMAKNG